MEILLRSRRVVGSATAAMVLLLAGCSAEHDSNKAQECPESIPALHLAEATTDPAEPGYSELTDPNWIIDAQTQHLNDMIPPGDAFAYTITSGMRLTMAEVACHNAQNTASYITPEGAAAAVRLQQVALQQSVAGS